MNGSSVYEENAVTTSNKGRLIVLLYSGAIKFLKQSIIAIQHNDINARNQCIGKAMDIIYELNTVLDMEVGGQISKNLRSLYNYMTRRLVVANTRQDVKMIQEVIGLLEELNSGWKAIAQ